MAAVESNVSTYAMGLLHRWIGYTNYNGKSVGPKKKKIKISGAKYYKDWALDIQLVREK